MESKHKAIFRVITPIPDITGDHAGVEPGNFHFIAAKTNVEELEIASSEVAYLYVDIAYNIGSITYNRLSWKVAGPAIVAASYGIVYSIAEDIQFDEIPEVLNGIIYVRSIVS